VKKRKPTLDHVENVGFKSICAVAGPIVLPNRQEPGAYAPGKSFGRGIGY